MEMYVKVHSHVMSAFAFFFDLCSPALENSNHNYEHKHLITCCHF